MTVAIMGGYVVPVKGEPIEGGTVLIENGKIVAVGVDADVEVPDDAEIVDAAGTWVLPGFVEAHGHAGVGEEGLGWEGRDYNEMTDPNGARLRAIGGQTAALKVWGRTVEDMLLRAPCSMKSALGENPKRVYGEQKTLPSTRLGVAAVIRDAFVKAQDYVTKRDDAASEDKPFDRDTTLESLALVLSGELPWCQHSHRADDIATAIRLADEFGYRLVVNHGTEGHLLADTLAERDIPVIIGPLFTSRSKVEVNRRSLRNPGILARAGVKIAITTDHPVVPVDFLVHQATLSVKEGLDTDTALRSITINPAEILGLDDRVGALAPGLDADVVLWSGDPLDVMSRAVRVFVNGIDVYQFDDATGEGVTKSPWYQERP